MKTLAILPRNGDAVRATLALHQAVEAVAGGRRVALVDMAPRRSAADWWRYREAHTLEPAEVGPNGKAPHKIRALWRELEGSLWKAVR
jgi:cellulose biosynthesis protein BcsQ